VLSVRARVYQCRANSLVDVQADLARTAFVRTRVYNSIVDLLSDGKWHGIAEIGQVTTYVDDWVRVLEREPRFEFDAYRAMFRLRSANVVVHTAPDLQAS